MWLSHFLFTLHYLTFHSKGFAVCINRWIINVYIHIHIKLCDPLWKKKSVPLYVATYIMNTKHWFSLRYCQIIESAVGTIWFLVIHLKDQTLMLISLWSKLMLPTQHCFFKLILIKEAGCLCHTELLSWASSTPFVITGGAQSPAGGESSYKWVPC